MRLFERQFFYGLVRRRRPLKMLRVLRETHLILIFSFATMSTAEEESARWLMYTNGGVFKLVLGWAVPLEVPMSVVFAHNLQFQYPPIDNATKLSELIHYGLARSRSFTRWDLYEHIEGVLKGVGSGTEGCLLKMICQISEAPISHNGLFGEILQLLFTPELEGMDKYNEAWWYGQAGDDCEDVYDCPRGSGFLDKFSILKHV